eukprot:3070430-Pleurochrysis_carterae.AAC.1
MHSSARRVSMDASACRLSIHASARRVCLSGDARAALCLSARFEWWAASPYACASPRLSTRAWEQRDRIPPRRASTPSRHPSFVDAM